MSPQPRARRCRPRSGRPASHQVDDAVVLGLQAQRDLHHHGVVAELLAQLVGDAHGVGAGAVALVHEGEARHLVALHLAVDGDRLRLHARHRAEHQHGAVEHPQGPLHLDGEVDVARRVDDVDVVAVPDAVGGRRLDGDAALALEIHGVHGGAHAVLALHLVNGADTAGIEEDPLGQRGLARVDVGADADVADPGEIDGHGLRPWLARCAAGGPDAAAAGKQTRLAGANLGADALVLREAGGNLSADRCVCKACGRILARF